MQVRIHQLQSKMCEQGFAAAILMHPRDIFYYAGTGQPCNLIVPARGEAILLARRVLDWVKADATVSDVRQGKGLSEIREILETAGISEVGSFLGLSLDVLPAQLYLKIQKTFPSFSLRNISPLILDQRLSKESSEIEIIGTAALLFGRAHEVILNELGPGITELELAAKIGATLRQGGHDGILRFRRWDASLPSDGILAAGENTWRISGHAMTVTGVGLSKAYPWGASNKQIQTGDLVVSDLGLNYHGYHADVARTYVVGRADAKQKHLFDVVLEIQNTVLQAVKPGVRGSELFQVARETALRMGVEEFFQGFGELQGDYIGHGVGLELDEPPTIDSQCTTLIRENMTLAIEPKVIIPGWGAINLEDTIRVTTSGYEFLSSIPRELFEVT